MTLVLRTSASTAGGTPKSWSSGGRPSNAAPSTSLHGFWDIVTKAQNDAGYTDYRCLFVYNNGSNVMNQVTVSIGNKGGGATVTVAASSTATNTFASYNTATIAAEETAPSITGSYGSSVNLGTLNPGQVKAVWLKRYANRGTGVSDTCTVVLSAQEVIPE